MNNKKDTDIHCSRIIVYIMIAVKTDVTSAVSVSDLCCFAGGI